MEVFHGTATECQSKVIGRTAEEESLEATSENRHRRCGRDVLRQTVSKTDSNSI